MTPVTYRHIFDYLYFTILVTTGMNLTGRVKILTHYGTYEMCLKF